MKETISADGFRIADGVYHFPFKVLDDNLGRIEWHFEPIGSGKEITKIFIWATQTNSPTYKGKIFEIPCRAEMIGGDSHNGNELPNKVWSICHCPEHGSLIFSCYPENNHSVLQIDVSSSIAVEMRLK